LSLNAPGVLSFGMDRLHDFRIAASSRQESHTGLRVAVAWGQLRPREVEPAPSSWTGS